MRTRDARQPNLALTPSLASSHLTSTPSPAQSASGPRVTKTCKACGWTEADAIERPRYWVSGDLCSKCDPVDWGDAR